MKNKREIKNKREDEKKRNTYLEISRGEKGEIDIV